MRLCILFPV